MRRFKEKVVIVTGAGTGIGRATAIRFAKEGAKVALVGATQQNLEAVSEELPQDHTWIHTDNHVTITCDITQKSQVQAMVSHIIEKFDHIDVVVVTNTVPLAAAQSTAISAEAWRNTLDVNVNGTFYVCQAVMPELITTKGTLINTITPSDIGEIGNESSMAAYQTAKASVVSLSQALAIENAIKGVRVNTVSTSVIKNEVTASKQQESHQTDTSQTQQQLTAASCPLGRLASADDIAAAITFLASDDAAMITGTELIVDGGVGAANMSH